MGDRVSIQFQNGEDKSVVLFSHWDGMSLVKEAQSYVLKLKYEADGKQIFPLQRMEPGTVMLDFISHYIGGNRVTSNYYIECTPEDGDNSDNGHHIIDCKVS
jgi:hypothetical protein